MSSPSNPRTSRKENSPAEHESSPNSDSPNHQHSPSSGRISRSGIYKPRGLSQFSLPTYYSDIEQQVVDAKQPLTFATSGFIKASRFSGLQLNLHEELEFKGPRSLSTYEINDDPSPLVIRKQSAPVNYTQQVKN
jgi:hypothetical protein